MTQHQDHSNTGDKGTAGIILRSLTPFCVGVGVVWHSAWRSYRIPNSNCATPSNYHSQEPPGSSRGLLGCWGDRGAVPLCIAPVPLSLLLVVLLVAFLLVVLVQLAVPL
jgi:hypothetical protein